MTKRLSVFMPAVAFIAGHVAPAPALANDVESFYKGRQVTVVVSTSQGGGYDSYARMVTRHMARQIPGNPTMVARNMPGAAHVRAANWLYAQAPQDGSAIGTVGQTIPDFQLFDGTGVEYDAKRFNWIGNPIAGNNVVVLWHTTGIRTIEQLMTRTVSIGASGPNSTASFYPSVMNNVLGTKFKIISGYPGGNEINLAMERGEVEGRGSNSWASWKATRPDWVAEGKLLVITQIGPRKEADLPNVPLLSELARNEEERHILNSFSASIALGRPLLTGPGVPADRVQALRNAFRLTMSDREFLAEAEKAKFDIDPVYGDELQRVVAEFMATPKELIPKIKAAMMSSDLK